VTFSLLMRGTAKNSTTSTLAGPSGGGIITYKEGDKQYVAVMSGRPSSFWVDEIAGSPTVFLFALP
jgi:hypothetical protein